jgi:hypothetical protein
MQTYSDQMLILPWVETESMETLQFLEPHGSLHYPSSAVCSMPSHFRM